MGERESCRLETSEHNLEKKTDITQAQEEFSDVSVETKCLVGNILDNICEVSESG